jgi:hypothetical protein
VAVTLPHHDERTGRAILPKTALVDGAYYVGRCRNATIARWSATRNAFFHWRQKFDQIFVEEIQHPVDEECFDVFRVVCELTDPKFEIPIDTKATFAGKVEDLCEHDHEMWSPIAKTSVP